MNGNGEKRYGEVYMTNWSKDNFNVAIPTSIARLDFNQNRDQHIKNYTALENVIGKEILEAESPLSFLHLHDTPSSYSGQGGKYIRVNSSEDGLEFAEAAGGGIGIIRESIYTDVPRFNMVPRGTGGNAVIPALELWLFPFINPTEYKYTEIGILNPVSQSLNIKLTLYNSVYNYYSWEEPLRSQYFPLEKIFESEKLSMQYPFPVSFCFEQTLQAGLYWLGIATEAETQVHGFSPDSLNISCGLFHPATRQIRFFCGYRIGISSLDDPLPTQINIEELAEIFLTSEQYAPLIMIA
jgi:hypothetical protein